MSRCIVHNSKNFQWHEMSLRPIGVDDPQNYIIHPTREVPVADQVKTHTRRFRHRPNTILYRSYFSTNQQCYWMSFRSSASRRRFFAWLFFAMRRIFSPFSTEKAIVGVSYSKAEARRWPQCQDDGVSFERTKCRRPQAERFGDRPCWFNQMRAH